MTDDSATLRAMAERLLNRRAILREDDLREIGTAILSWAKEKAELERQLADADMALGNIRTMTSGRELIAVSLWAKETMLKACERNERRHASRPVTAKD